MSSDVAEDEPHEIERVMVLRIELDRPLERTQRFLVQSTMIEYLTKRELKERALGVEHERLFDARLGTLHVPGLLFGKRELEKGADVIRVVLQQDTEFFSRLFVLAQQRERATKLPARVTVFGTRAKTFAELGYSSIVIAGIEVRDLEVAARDLHFSIELERFHQRADGFLVQSLVVIQDAEVVVRPGVRRIDPAGERTKYVAVTLGRENHGSGYANGLEDGLQRRGVGKEQEITGQFLADVAQTKLALDAEH